VEAESFTTYVSDVFRSSRHSPNTGSGSGEGRGSSVRAGYLPVPLGGGGGGLLYWLSIFQYERQEFLSSTSHAAVMEVFEIVLKRACSLLTPWLTR
jgi:hypothetical protein